ncbi:MAG: hypothetical protein J5972_01525 [Eubacterium sp.]|nr:hypothetical protein [Eubacterium sp.]
MSSKYIIAIITSVVIIMCCMFGIIKFNQYSENQIAPKEKIVTTSQDVKTDENTKCCIQVTYANSQREDDYVMDIPAEFLGKTREEVVSLLEKIKENGVSSMSLVSFSREQIMIEKKYDSPSGNGFVIKSVDKEIGIYEPTGRYLYEKTGVYIDELTEIEQAQIKKGIYVKNEEELYSILENFSS